jgi:hypothetical protein
MRFCKAVPASLPELRTYNCKTNSRVTATEARGTRERREYPNSGRAVSLAASVGGLVILYLPQQLRQLGDITASSLVSNLFKVCSRTLRQTVQRRREPVLEVWSVRSDRVVVTRQPIFQICEIVHF